MVLDIDGPCWAAGATAAALHGFRLQAPFDIVVPRGRHPQRLGQRIHTTTSIERIDQTVVDGLPTLTPTRTLIDLAARSSIERLTAALDSALRDGGTSEDFLHRRMVALRRSGRPGVGRLMDVVAGADATRGGHSWLEREFLRLVQGAGLRCPATQQTSSRRGDRLVRVDCRFDATPVVVELLGYRWHRTRQQMQVDAERMNRLILDGFVPIQLTYVDVVERPAASIEVVREALGAHL